MSYNFTQTGIQEWRDEHLLFQYPLQPHNNQSLPNDLFIDAHFIQFDNFIPSIVDIQVYIDSIIFSLLFDYSTYTLTINRDTFVVGQQFEFRINGRYIGFIIAGDGVNTLWNNNIVSFGSISLPFSPFVVRSISSSSGVYEIGGKVGAVKFTNSNTVQISSSSNILVFNAIDLTPSSNALYLKTINTSITPTNNNVFLKDSDLIKINSSANKITFSLAKESLQNIFI